MDIVALRKRLGLSQRGFAERYGIAVASVRNWEQGRRGIDSASQVLLCVIDANPGLVAEAVSRARLQGDLGNLDNGKV